MHVETLLTLLSAAAVHCGVGHSAHHAQQPQHHHHSHQHHHQRPHRAATDANDLVVATTKGLVSGIALQSAAGKPLVAFLGIPFATPPVGRFRFRHPKPIDPWPGVFNASQVPASCVQIVDNTFGVGFRGTDMWNPNTPMSEDCLKLNIWVPRPRPTNSPVLVWVYGGGFYSGTATLDLYDGRTLATEENIIVVSIGK